MKQKLMQFISYEINCGDLPVVYTSPQPRSLMKFPRSARSRRRVTVSTRVLSHKLALLLASMTVAAQFAPSTAIAQTAESGSLRGRVLNAANGMYLGNARVTVEGTNIETFTNQFGEYTVSNVPAGTVTIRVTYTGQTPQTAAVTIAAGQEATHNVSFNTEQSTTADDGTLVLNEFTVAANRFRSAQELAVNEQRNAVNIKNVISVDQFGDIPSGNVGELVKFLPGVQLDYGSFGGNNQGYSDNEASGISVRGFGPEDTAILIDGMPVTNATPGNLTRQVALDQLSINNASRVELIKVPTPDMPANSIGGQVNLITKTAFEQARPSYSGRIFFNANSLNASLKKTPGPVKDKTFKTTPGLEASVTVPFSSKFGISFTASGYDDANQAYRAAPVWARSGNGTNAQGAISISNPILNRYQITDTSSYVEHRSSNLRLDWKPTPHQTLRTNVQYSTYDSQEGQRRLDFRPTIAAGADWGATYTTGTTANSTTDMTVTTRDKEGDTRSAQAQYQYKRGGWAIDLAGNISISESSYNDRKNGHFSELALKLNPGQVRFNSIVDGGVVNSITTMNRVSNGGGVRDYTVLSNYGFDGTIAKSGEAETEVTNKLFKADIERDLSFLPFLRGNSLSLKVGARRDSEKNEKSGLGTGYAEILRTGASYTVADILDTYYLGQDLGFGLGPQQWGSTYRLFELNQANDLFYAPTGPESTNTQVNNYNSWVNQQKAITETKDAYYAMLSGRFFSNRLSIIAGARQENAKREGRSAYTDNKWNYLRRADGSVWSNSTYASGVIIDQGNGTIDVNGNWVPPATGTPNRPIFDSGAAGIALRAVLAADGVAIPKPLHPSNTHLSSRMLQLQPNRYVHAKIEGDPSFSFNTSYKLTDKIDLKAAWSQTFGLPKLEDGATGLVSGNNTFTLTDYTETERLNNNGYGGVFSIANPYLLPSESKNWDFAVSYYTDSGGQFTVSYWRKSVTNQPMTFVTDANSPQFDELITAMGFDPNTYRDYFIRTATNGETKQKTSGWEFEVRHDFGFLGRWGRNVGAFASYAINELGQPEVPRPYVIMSPSGPVTQTPTAGTITQRSTQSGGAGIQYSGTRFSAQIRGVYRNENEVARTDLGLLPDGQRNYLRRYQPSETRIDVSLGYVINKNFSLFLSGRDVFNASRKQTLKDDFGLYPSYADLFDYREFGVIWTAGVNAKF
jgi:iron complex outermembrane receptor protein